MFLINFLRKFNFRGKGRIINDFFKLKPFNGIINYKNIKVNVDTSELISWYLYWFGDYEPEVNWVLDELLTEEDVCVDVGANIGVYTLIMAKCVKKVISIEPHPEYYKKLIYNVKINKFSNVKTFNIAITKFNGSSNLYAPNDNMSNKTATLENVTKHIPDQSLQFSVKTKTFDTIFNMEKKINFIKIDADWHDASIIISGLETIKKLRPIIMFEDLATTKGHEDWDIKEKNAKEYNYVYEILGKNQYSFYLVDNKKLIIRTDTVNNLQNTLAVPNEKINIISDFL